MLGFTAKPLGTTMSVCRGPARCNKRFAYRSTRAAAVIDVTGWAHALLSFCPSDRVRVGAAAGRERDDDMHRARGMRLREGEIPADERHHSQANRGSCYPAALQLLRFTDIQDSNNFIQP
jgi:hypothetical protein